MIELQNVDRFTCIFQGMSEADVVRIMKHPRAMFETDGDLVEFGEGHPHPRSYGSFPRILGKYVREDSVLTLETAIHKMTQMPARWLGQTDRGELREGLLADVVVFDADQIVDRATYTQPHRYSEGVEHVIINGEIVLKTSELMQILPGRFLQRKRLPPQ